MILIFISFSLAFVSNGQRKALVEHFTNSRCPVCKSNNPSFYNTFNQNLDKAYHIAYHPSVPYSSCIFYQANKEGNGARQSYYNISGTPSAFINGKKGSTNLLTNSDYLTAYNAIDYFNIQFIEANSDKVGLQITVIRQLPSGGDYNLFLALTENEIDLLTPNGESTHYDVFRTFFTDNSGYHLNIPADIQVGSSISLTFDNNYTFPSGVALSDFSITAFIQDNSTKSIMDVERTAVGTLNLNYYEYAEELEITLYPNPAKDFVNLDWKNPAFKPNRVSIFSEDGRMVQNGLLTARSQHASVYLNQLLPGTYYIYLYSTFVSDKAYSRFIVK